MEKVSLKVVFVPIESERPLQQIIDELVKDTIKKTLSERENTGYNGVCEQENHLGGTSYEP